MADSPGNKVHLSFTLGPVQAFVSQSRRTRDLWAGSWLLSYLAECALVAAEQAGGTAIIPFRENPGQLTSKQTAIGGVPNRFEMSFDSVDLAKTAANRAADAVREAWKKIADVVFESFVQPVADSGNGTRAIWNQQTKNFWEVSWVMGVPEESMGTIAHLAAARKNIRNVRTAPEQGVKCSLMGTLQEVSGCYGSKQKQFWEKLRKQSKSHGLDLKEGERLCAIALIKRLFPHVIEEAIGSDICDDLKQQNSWPSTAFLAALPWLKLAESKPSSAGAINDYAQDAQKADWKNSEYQASGDAGLKADWAKLDGPIWFSEAVRQNEPKAGPSQVDDLLKKLKAVYEEVGGKPVPYYALLLMDGDSMGKLVSTLGSPKEVSQGLDHFSQEVGGIVSGELGRTIYAGGDDVMAILPAGNALAAADALARQYANSFEGDATQATLSGAIVYAHWKFPLRQVLRTAHHLLDDIAKERTGRDSLALGIIQGSGPSAVWSAPWAVVRGEEKENGFGKLSEFIDCFGSDSTGKETTEFNASFLYHLREQFSKLFIKSNETPGSFRKTDLADGLLVDIANSEHRRRMTKADRTEMSPEETRKKMEPLLAVNQPWQRNEDDRSITRDATMFGFDGWRIARFLKQVKDGKVDGHE